MASTKTTQKSAKKPTTKKPAAKKTSTSTAKHDTFTAEERAAMKEYAKELKAEKEGRTKAAAEKEVLDKIAAMKGSDRAIAERFHAIVKDEAPELAARTWYGMPAYAKDGKVLCFFQDAAKFKARYATIGFSDVANLDNDAMWPTSFAVMQLGDAEEKKLRALLKKAVH
jgi:uncharacterized protein YdhG (YjbR/CyaY superfamily)